MDYSVMPMPESEAHVCTELVNGRTVHRCLLSEAPIQPHAIRVSKPRYQVEYIRHEISGSKRCKDKQRAPPWNSRRRYSLYSGWLITALMISSLCPFANAVFIQTPIPLNVTFGDVANFFCSVNDTVTSLFFLANGSSLVNVPGVTVVSGASGSELQIVASVEYNNTMIGCGSFTSGEGEMRTTPVLLRVQGLLAAVVDPQIDLVNGSLCLSWTPPFTLDITGIEPDIHYIIEIIANVANSTISVIPCDDCPLATPEYKFTMENSSPCDSFTFVVIPTNGAGNGRPSNPPLEGAFIQVSPENFSITTVLVTVLQSDQLMIEASYPFTGVCQYDVTITSRDNLMPVFLCRVELSADIESRGLTFAVRNGNSCHPLTLPFNRIFNMSIAAENSAGSVILAEALRLSTHDAQDANITVGPMPGTVTVSVTYAVNTSAMGHLTILVNNINMAIAFTAPDRSSQVTIIRGLPADVYTALVFDVESSGLPSTAAADSEVISVDEGSDESQPTDSNLSAEVEVNPNSDICTSCNFATNNSVGCVVIMYSATTQLVVHSISREEPSESIVEECFTVPFGDYTVAVFNRASNNMIALNPATISYVSVIAPSPTPSPTARPSNNDISSTTLIGIAIGAVIILFIIIILLVCLIYCRHKSCSKKTDGRVQLLRQQSTFSSAGASFRTVQDGASPSIGRAIPDGNEILETHLSGPDLEAHTTTDISTAVTFGYGGFGYATIGPAASPGPDKNKTVDYTQVDLSPGSNQPPLIDPVPYQTVQVEPASAKVKTSKYAELDLPRNENPPPQADTVTYQTVQAKPASARPSQPPKPTLPALNINDLDILLILIRPIQFMWYQLGSQLGIRDDFLNQIAEFSSDPSLCSTEMLSQWLEYQPESSEPTWEDITKAIQQLGEDSDSAKQVAEQFQHVVATGMRPEMQHSPLLLPANETPPPLPPRADSQSWPADEQLQSTPSPLPTPVDVSPVPPPEDDLSEDQPSPRQSPSSPHEMMREPSYSSPDSPAEAPGTPNEEPLHLPQPRRAPPPPPTNISGQFSYLPTHALREEPLRQVSWRHSPPPPPIGELPPYSPPSSHPPPYTPPLTPRADFSSPPIEFHGTMV